MKCSHSTTRSTGALSLLVVCLVMINPEIILDQTSVLFDRKQTKPTNTTQQHTSNLTPVVLDTNQGKAESKTQESNNHEQLCTKRVPLIIYVQYLPRLNEIGFYLDLYGRYFKEVIFYVDGNWCDPWQHFALGEFPCYGPKLNLTGTLPSNVRVVQRQGGGWMMQKSLIDAITRAYQEVNDGEEPDVDGFLFITDDMFVNMRHLLLSGIDCNKIWLNGKFVTADVTDVAHTATGHKAYFERFFEQEKAFNLIADKDAKAMLTQNCGSPSAFAMNAQNDILYLPRRLCRRWTEVAQQMTDAGLVFIFPFVTGSLAIEPKENMVFLEGHYIYWESNRFNQMHTALANSSFDATRRCLNYDARGKGLNYVDGLLKKFDVIHPVKFSKQFFSNFVLAASRNRTSIQCSKL